MMREGGGGVVRGVVGRGVLTRHNCVFWKEKLQQRFPQGGRTGEGSGTQVGGAGSRIGSGAPAHPHTQHAQRTRHAAEHAADGAEQDLAAGVVAQEHQEEDAGGGGIRYHIQQRLLVVLPHLICGAAEVGSGGCQQGQRCAYMGGAGSWKDGQQAGLAAGGVCREGSGPKHATALASAWSVC